MRRSRRDCAVALVEVVIAAGVMALAMSGVYNLSLRSVRLLQAGNESTAALCMAQERVEQFRRASWAQLTDSAAWVDSTFTDPDTGVVENTDGLFKPATVSGGPLTGKVLTETVTVSSYRPTASAAPVRPRSRSRARRLA